MVYYIYFVRCFFVFISEGRDFNKLNNNGQLFLELYEIYDRLNNIIIIILIVQ